MALFSVFALLQRQWNAAYKGRDSLGNIRTSTSQVLFAPAPDKYWWTLYIVSTFKKTGWPK